MATAFYIAVEDDLSDAIARKLLNHVRRGFQVRARYPLPSLPHLRPELSGYGYLRANVQAFNKASAETPHFLLTDLDVVACAPKLIHEWLGGAAHPNFVLRVALREVEGWLLADANSMADFLGLSPGDIPANVESVAHAKEEIVRLARLSPDAEIQNNLAPRPGWTATTGRLFNRSLIGYVQSLLDIDDAAAKSDSLARALRALRSFKPTRAPKVSRISLSTRLTTSQNSIGCITGRRRRFRLKAGGARRVTSSRRKVPRRLMIPDGSDSRRSCLRSPAMFTTR